jgi:CDGSH-type Zn-finger protein
MTREIRCDGTGPIKVEPSDKPLWICGCGLTQNGPQCDGSHKKTRQEEDGKLYRYDDKGELVEVIENAG